MFTMFQDRKFWDEHKDQIAKRADTYNDNKTDDTDSVLSPETPVASKQPTRKRNKK